MSAKLFMLGAIVLLALTTAITGGTPVYATDTEGACPLYDTGILSGEGQTAITVTAPTGKIILNVCVQSGTSEVLLVPAQAKTVVATHSSGGAISHYSVDFGADLTIPPFSNRTTPTTIEVTTDCVNFESGKRVPLGSYEILPSDEGAFGRTDISSQPCGPLVATDVPPVAPESTPTASTATQSLPATGTATAVFAVVAAILLFAGVTMLAVRRL